MNELLSHYLGHRGASVYIAALQLGNTTIDKISRKAELPRSTCYLIIAELEEKGLLSRNTRGKKEYVQAESPERLVEYLQREKDRAQNGVQQILTGLPQYMAMYNTGHEKKPSCRYYEGFNGVKLILEDSLRATEILVLCSGYSGVIEPRLSKYLDTYFDEVERKGIHTYELLGGSPDTKDYIGTYESEFHKMREVDFGTKSKKSLKHIDKLIYGSCVATISFEELNGVVLENAPIAAFERETFFQLWGNKD